MFRGFFFLWFTFFLAVTTSITGFALVSRWLVLRDREAVEAHALTSFCLHQFLTEDEQVRHPDRWNWKAYYENWKTDFHCLAGLALEDRADGRLLVSYGSAFPETTPASLPSSSDQQSRWVTLETGQKLWTTLPAGKKNERYRLWLIFRPPVTFRAYLERRFPALAGVGALFVFLFLLFYWRVGTPRRFLDPMVETIQRALENAGSPLQVSTVGLPGEFVNTARALSLLLEARHKDYCKYTEFRDRVRRQKRQKEHYDQMFRTLQSTLENEQSSVERVQHSLLQANREPVIILDKTRRILAMNEAARRTLSLSGQTGYPLRHSEIEEILEMEIGSDSPPTDHRISVRDPYLRKTTRWRVHVSLHYHWDRPEELQYIIVSLNREENVSAGSDRPAENLVRLLAGAWAETWSSNESLPSPLSEEERGLVDQLTRKLFTVGHSPLEVRELLGLFGLGSTGALAPDVEFGEVSGGAEVWKAFGDWFHYVMRRMGRSGVRVELAGITTSRIKMEWLCDSHLRFPEWFGEGEDKTRLFRRELLQKVLERLRVKVSWHESAPNVVALEILLKARLATPSSRPGIPLRVEA